MSCCEASPGNDKVSIRARYYAPAPQKPAAAPPGLVHLGQRPSSLDSGELRNIAFQAPTADVIAALEAQQRELREYMSAWMLRQEQTLQALVCEADGGSGFPPQPPCAAKLSERQATREVNRRPVDINLGDSADPEDVGDKEFFAMKLDTTQKHEIASSPSRVSIGNGASGTMTMMENHLQREMQHHHEREYRELCNKTGSSTLTPQDLLRLRSQIDGKSASKKGKTVDKKECRMLETAIVAFNKAAGVTSAPCAEVTLDTYRMLIDIDAPQVTEMIPDAPVAEIVLELRAMLILMNATMHVALVTHVSVGNLVDPNQTEPILIRLMHWFDPVIGLTVVANSIVVGIKCDYAKDWAGWTWVDVVFTALFVIEILLRITALGIRKVYTGSDWMWGWFDSFITCFTVFDLVQQCISDQAAAQPVSLLRLLRFLRFARLVKVVRLRAFKDLSLMLTGIMVGLRTLMWAMLCLCYFIYVLGVVLTQLLGQSDASSSLCPDPDSGHCSYSQSQLERFRLDMFGSVGRSMFTIFRCYTDGCSSLDGTPLSPYLFGTYGLISVLVYVAISVFINFGLFNLIAAVFIHNTLETASEVEEQRREVQEVRKVELARQVQRIMVAFCNGAEHAPLAVNKSIKEKIMAFVLQLKKGLSISGAANEEMLDLDASDTITQDMFYAAMDRPDVQEILDELEVQKTNRKGLFEILDADESGSLEIAELVKGLLKLRNGGEKNDTVAMLLAVQAVRKSTKIVEEFCIEHDQHLGEVLGKVEESLTKMESLEQRMEAMTLQGAHSRLRLS